MYRCSRCGFQLHKRVVSLADGEVYRDDRLTRERCPNDGTLLTPEEEPMPDINMDRRPDYSDDVRSAALIDQLFTYHPPKPEMCQPKRYAAITAAFRQVADLLQQELPPSADKTVALRKLSEARMAANLAIACNE